MPKAMQLMRDIRLMTRTLATAILVALCLLTTALAAQPTQDEVFRSISDHVGGANETSSKPVLVVLGVALTVLILFGVFSQCRKREVAAPRALEHHGKLLRELSKAGVPLKTAELRQLKLLVEVGKQANDLDVPTSPLTFVLCPSVLSRVMQKSPAKVDRRIIAQLARKMKLATSR